MDTEINASHDESNDPVSQEINNKLNGTSEKDCLDVDSSSEDEEEEAESSDSSDDENDKELSDKENSNSDQEESDSSDSDNDSQDLDNTKDSEEDDDAEEDNEGEEMQMVENSGHENKDKKDDTTEFETKVNGKSAEEESNDVDCPDNDSIVNDDDDDDDEVEVGDHFLESEHEIGDICEDEESLVDKENTLTTVGSNNESSQMNPDSFLEPTCELAEATEDDHLFKSRFNLRKRSSNHSSNDDMESFTSEMNEEEGNLEVDETPIKKLKFNFPKKSNFRRQRPYTNEAVKEAIKMVQSKRMSILEASRQFDIPRTSLHNFLRLYRRGKKVGVNPISPGLNKREESEIVSLVIKLSRCGKRYSHNELRFLIQYYLVNNDRPVFKSGTLPTMGWIAGLVERQPDLTRAKSKKNTKVDIEDVEEWQKQIEDYLITDWDLDIDEIFRLENGHRIFCFNAFKMTVNGPSENAENKPANPIKKEPGTEEEKDPELSVILGMSADGTFEIPLVVFSDDHQDMSIKCDASELKVAFNKTARVEDDVALQMVKDFDEEIVHRGVTKPVILFVNDKQDMAHFSVIEYCWENQIVIVCLPPKTNKTMTPFEVGIWPKVRSSYSMLWKNATKSFDNKLSVDQFPELFSQAWKSACIPKQAVRGFVKSGLIPLNVPSILSESSSSEVLDESQLYHKRMLSSIKEEPVVVKSESSSALEERSKGKLEGIQMCLEAIETFIPPDIIPVWNNRGADYRGRCELAFKLWKSVSLLLKAGCAMASIQQMADGVFNPFETDFTASSFFHKVPNSASESCNTQSPAVAYQPPPAVSGNSSPEKYVPKKRKLNKSIYSISDTSPSKVNGVDEGAKFMKANNEDIPLVRLHQSPFLMHSVMDAD